MSYIIWKNLRSWNGSQNNAFEELCCQLAAYEQIQGSFTRKGTPDAGVECFWKLENNEEWGWQAKFFHSVDDSQWTQINKSVRTALNKHPHLAKYTICLPIDRPDARIEGQKSLMDKWNEKVEMWEGWAKEKDMSVEFIYWGEHEIGERLSREDHKGRFFFWFNEEYFSNQWFEHHINETIADVGPRYSPELNVEIPIAQLFDGLGRTKDFYLEIINHNKKLKQSFSKIHCEKTEIYMNSQLNSLMELENQILLIIDNINMRIISHIDYDSILKSISKSKDIAWECLDILENCTDANPIDYELYLFDLLIDNLDELDSYFQSNKALLANIPALLIVGNAGTGKTHILCDVAKERIKSDLPTILLLGGKFKNDEPWSQIIKQLGLSCNKEEFLGAIEAGAQARGSKTIILIDALNEGEGKELWNRYLAGILETLSRYSWISIGISIRTSYEKTVIPEELDLIRVTHSGFIDNEYQATRTFFDYFGIEHPSIPLLIPEFQNPLFLKLFCQGLRNNEMTKIPNGFQGITYIFKFFIESINKKLSRREYLNFDEKSMIVQSSIEKITEIMAEKNTISLKREEAKTIIDSFHPHNGYENSLFRHMISEGLLSENNIFIDENKSEDVIQFSYERFSDHLIAKHLLNKYLDSDNPHSSFQQDMPLGSIMKNELECMKNRGILEAFSIQIPEKINMELVDIAPYCADFQPYREALIESLIWRKLNAINDSTKKYIDEHVLIYQDTHEQLLNTLLTIASIPEHPFNADFLHRNLIINELSERDATWSIFLHYQYGTHGAVDRLVDWALSTENKNHINDESIRLSGIVLSWFLTTSNRYLRDRATKALISLLTFRIHILRNIMREFLYVNDFYVTERLFAVAYGCVMRNNNDEQIDILAKDVYEWIFKSDNPPPHILLRDYARGVIEAALHSGIYLDIDIQKVRPPYNSKWPSDIPLGEELEKYGEWQEDIPYNKMALIKLYLSVMGHGDFARYIIGTNSGHFQWSSCRLNEQKNPKRTDFDLSIAQRWIFKRVLELGWSEELFGRFDQEIEGHWRDANKPERIGKKYQWIAYHEFLAMVSDNFEYDNSWNDKSEKYEGPWQIYVRDIDPSCLLRNTNYNHWEPHENNWWFPIMYDTWDSELDDIKWLESDSDLPSVEKLLKVINHTDESKWFILEAFYEWEQPTPPEQERFEIPHRDLWYLIKSYIIKKSEIDEIMEWAKKQNFKGRWMPESLERHSVFLGEFPWASAFDYHDIPYHVGWTRGDDNIIPKEVLVSTDKYMQEKSGYDCSIDDNINIILPSKWLIENMCLNWNGFEGYYFNENNKLIAFDPSIRAIGPSVLLINQDEFLEFLNVNDYDILWTIVGEKNIIWGYKSAEEFRGRKEISGVFRLNDDEIEGTFKTKLRPRDNYRT